jgi:DNA-binding IclR family transcriptional regulator
MAEQQGIQSVDAAVRILQALSSVNRPMSLKDIAIAADMTASNTHRYLVSFIKAKLVYQETGSGKYDLGPFALHLGLAAMSRMDSITVGTQILHELLVEIDMPVTLSVWTPEGPTMIRWLDASHPLTVNHKTGSRSPMLTSASGRVFLAFESEEKIKNVLAAEMRARKGRKETTLVTQQEVSALRAEVRRRGLGRSIGERVTGINGLSAPIFDALGQLALTISIVGLERSFDPSYDGVVARALRAAADRASILLGYRPHLGHATSERQADSLQEKKPRRKLTQTE